MKMAKLVCGSFLGSMLLAGCATYEQVGPGYVIGDDKVIEYAKYTNPVAEEMLKALNSSELATELGGPFRIEDYLVKLDPDKTPDIVRLEYTLRKQVGVRGCPQQFTVLLNTRTGEAGQPCEITDCERCARNMLELWKTSLSFYSAESMKKDLPPSSIRTNLVSVAMMGLLCRNAVTSCPLGASYSDFVMAAGPVCPDGHSISLEDRTYMRLMIVGPANREDLLEALRSQSRTIRLAAIGIVPWTDFLDTEEKRNRILERVKDPDPMIRLYALDGYRCLHDHSPAVPREILEALQDPDTEVRSKAQGIVKRTNQEPAGPPRD